MAPRPLILMTDPAGFDVSYSINPWMRPALWRADPAGHARAARAAFEALAQALRRAGAKLEIVPGASGLPDMAFPANAAVVLDGRALMSRFRPPERRGEEPRFLAAFQALKARGLVREVSHLPPGVFQEGAGDFIWDARRGVFWAGYGQRSSLAGAQAAAAFFGKEAVTLELVSERFYHLDTCFCPLSGGEALYYPPAFSPRALETLRARIGRERLIEATGEDAAGLCVNAVSLGRTLVMATPPDRLRAKLAERGYHIEAVDLAPFILSGGAAFCMTLRLDLESARAAAPASP
ncbi:MAG: dimethylarginine dimethylaminohydrolase family protein [Caulobacteraceae bacterium]